MANEVKQTATSIFSEDPIRIIHCPIKNRIYEIMEIGRVSEPALIPEAFVNRANALEACAGEEDCKFILENQSGIPAYCKENEIYLVFPGWNHPDGQKIAIAMLRFISDEVPEHKRRYTLGNEWKMQSGLNQWVIRWRDIRPDTGIANGVSSKNWVVRRIK